MNAKELSGPPTPRRLALQKMEKEKAEARRSKLKTRLPKLALFTSLSAVAASLAGPPLPLYTNVLAGSLVSTLPGLYDAHLAVSYGYGAALVWQASLFFAVVRRSFLSQPGGSLLLLAAYALYGLKVCIFQFLRDIDPAYVAKALEPARARQATDGSKTVPAVGFSTARLPLVVGVGALLSTFSFPLHAATSAVSASALVPLGALVALGGLLFQTIADAQKFVLKRQSGADALCTQGLWLYSRHPNYLGEIIFQAGVIVAGLAASLASGSLRLSLGRCLLSLLAPVTFISIMLASTRSLEERQLEAYKDSVNYRQYVRVTPRLFPFKLRPRAYAAALVLQTRALLTPAKQARIEDSEDDEPVDDDDADASAMWTGRAMAVADEVVPGSGGADDNDGDATRAALEEQIATEERGAEIEGIIGVTGLAAVATVVVGVVGSLLF